MVALACRPTDSLNLATHVGGKIQAVESNRNLLVASARLPHMPIWLKQVHSTHVLRLEGQPLAYLHADAALKLSSGADVCGDDSRLSTGIILFAGGR